MLAVMGLALALAPVPSVLAAPPEGGEDATEKAKSLYQEGEKAYRLGKFQDAITNFEAAYELAAIPLILYNLGLAYDRLGDQQTSADAWRKAKSLLENFAIELQRDPELGDPAEVETLLAKIDKKIADYEEKESLRNAANNANAGGDEPKAYTPTGPDPGKKLRLGGVIGMGAGGGVLVAGGALLTVFALRGQEFSNELENIYDDQEAAGCTPSNTSAECEQLRVDEDTARENGETSNRLALGVGLPVMIVGVAGIAVGGALYAVGNKRTKEWKRGPTARVTPVVTPTFGGFVLTGRF
jgi:tetratricopeptide (TPR) repeat protein